MITLNSSNYVFIPDWMEEWSIFLPFSEARKVKEKIRIIERNDKKIIIEYSDHGVLTVEDLLVFLAMTNLWHRYGRPKEEILFSYEDILEVLKLKKTSYNIKKLKKSLLKLRFTRLTLINVLPKPEGGFYPEITLNGFLQSLELP